MVNFLNVVLSDFLTAERQIGDDNRNDGNACGFKNKIIAFALDL
jgi:hypothetical protein